MRIDGVVDCAVGEIPNRFNRIGVFSIDQMVAPKRRANARFSLLTSASVSVTLAIRAVNFSR
jgi:hypothetical protein